ncbi:MAG TPA: hypothetical protein VFM66_09755, partial [Agromyces sp.]|nr:hypothetical protein [Agromyces sp.]
NPMLVRRLVAAPPDEHERTIAFKRFAYEGLVDRARGEIEWAKRGLDLVDNLEASVGTWTARSATSSRVESSKAAAP